MDKRELIEQTDGYEPPIPPDTHPSFFCAYLPPATHVAALVQQPHHNIDADSLSVAYMRDWRASRRALLRALEARDG